MNIRKKLSILTLMLFCTLLSITSLSLWNWNRMQRLHQTILLGQQLQNQSQKVIGLMKDIIFDLFAPTMYSQIRSLTYSPRSVATYKTWRKAVEDYELVFTKFVGDRELEILQDEELQDIYNTALTLNQKALDRLNSISPILQQLQKMDLEGGNLYMVMQQDESLIPFFQEFRDTSYYFTNTFQSYMNHFFTSFRKQSLKLERQLYLLFLLVSILAGFISILYSTLISREILMKISLVGTAFKKISRGDFSASYAPADRDELSSLLLSINDLSHDLKDNINSILNLTRDMGTSLEEGNSRDDIMNLIAETIINDTSSDSAAVYLYDPLENHFDLQAHQGEMKNFPDHLAGDSPSGKLLKKGVVISDGESALLLERDMLSPEIRPAGLIAVPLTIRENFTGFLTALISGGASGFSDLGITRIINFAAYASLSIDNHFKYREVLEKREAEYNALQSQVQPHFIYNILNSLIGLNRMGSKDKLEKAILALREMLRYVTDQNRWTSLGEETAFLRSYCDLQKIRFGERLNYRFEIPGDLETFQIPKLLLQPLVENSIIHGLEPKEEGGELSLTAAMFHEKDHSKLILNLADTGCGFAQNEKDGKSHVGLRNVKDRLSMTYPGSEFLVHSIIGKGTSILITIIKKRENEL